MTENGTARPEPAWHAEFLRKFGGRPPPQALLLRGPRGVGKRHLALALAHIWLARGDADARAVFDSANHPDLQIVEPREPGAGGTGQQILIEQVRDLLPFCMCSPALARRRVALICPACEVNRNAANALLKLLEEPPPATSFVLVAHDASRLPATVRSRCQDVAAPVPTAAQAREWLAAAGVEAPKAALALYGRAPFRIAEMEGMDLLETLVGFLRTRGGATAGEIAGMLAKARGNDWMDWLLKWVCDVAAVSFGAQPSYFSGYAGDLEGIAARGSQRDWLDLQEELAGLGAAARANPNRQMLAERALGTYLLCAGAA